MELSSLKELYINSNKISKYNLKVKNFWMKVGIFLKNQDQGLFLAQKLNLQVQTLKLLYKKKHVKKN